MSQHFSTWSLRRWAVLGSACAAGLTAVWCVEHKRLIFCFLPVLFLALAIGLSRSWGQGTPLSLSELERTPLSIETAAGKTHAFDVYIADTPVQHAQGLMYVEDLAPDAGMLFTYNRPKRMSMWMKNTLIPLDMLFIAKDGRIVNIGQRAVPGSLAAISSKGKVSAALELNGGTVSRLGIKPGDLVRQAFFQE